MYIEVERSDVAEVGKVWICAVREWSSQESSCGIDDGEISAKRELRVVSAGGIHSVSSIVLHGFDVEEAVSIVVSIIDKLVPTSDVEGVVVAKVSVATRNGRIDLEETVAVNA